MSSASQIDETAEVRDRPSRRLASGDILSVLAAAAAIGIFLILAFAVHEGVTAAFDRIALLALRARADVADPIGPPWVREFGRDMTSLGSLGFLTILTLSTAGFLWLRSRRRLAVLLIVSFGGGRAFASLLKFMFDRPRPDLVPHGAFVTSSSFPSTHSMMAAIVYLTLAALLAGSQSRSMIRVYVMLLGCLFAFLVGTSRIYLGVHWPTDVLAGWLAGGVWSTLTLVVARHFDTKIRIP